MRSGAIFLLATVACSGAIEKENVATTSDAGLPPPNDASTSTLDATVTDGGVVIVVDGGTAPCATDPDCNGGTCFEGVCMCQAPKYVQQDGKCGDAEPGDCAKNGGTCRQEPAVCQAGELDTHIYTSMTCGDFVAAVCCVPAASCKTTVDFVCCGASTTPYEPTCVNGWRTCAGGGPLPKLRSDKCP